jgi:hypothetical protein
MIEDQGTPLNAEGPRPVAAVIPLVKPEAARPNPAGRESPPEPDDPAKPPTGGRPALKRVK